MVGAGQSSAANEHITGLAGNCRAWSDGSSCRAPPHPHPLPRDRGEGPLSEKESSTSPQVGETTARKGSPSPRVGETTAAGRDSPLPDDCAGSDSPSPRGREGRDEVHSNSIRIRPSTLSISPRISLFQNRRTRPLAARSALRRAS